MDNKVRAQQVPLVSTHLPLSSHSTFNFTPFWRRSRSFNTSRRPFAFPRQSYWNRIIKSKNHWLRTPSTRFWVGKSRNIFFPLGLKFMLLTCKESRAKKEWLVALSKKKLLGNSSQTPELNNLKPVHQLPFPNSRDFVTNCALLLGVDAGKWRRPVGVKNSETIILCLLDWHMAFSNPLTLSTIICIVGSLVMC